MLVSNTNADMEEEGIGEIVSYDLLSQISLSAAHLCLDLSTHLLCPVLFLASQVISSSLLYFSELIHPT